MGNGIETFRLDHYSTADRLLEGAAHGLAIAMVAVLGLGLWKLWRHCRRARRPGKCRTWWTLVAACSVFLTVYLAIPYMEGAKAIHVATDEIVITYRFRRDTVIPTADVTSAAYVRSVSSFGRRGRRTAHQLHIKCQDETIVVVPLSTDQASLEALRSATKAIDPTDEDVD